MLGLDVIRSDWRDVLRDRAFRRGLILLPAGERALRFYPRYDTSEAVIREAIEIFGGIRRGHPGARGGGGAGPTVEDGVHVVPPELSKSSDWMRATSPIIGRA